MTGVWAVSAWSPRRRLGAGLGLSVLGAAGLIAALDPVGAWPLIFVSLIPILYAQHAVLPQRWAGLAPAVGMGGYVAYSGWGALTASQRPWLIAAGVLLWVGGLVERRWHELTGYRHLWWSGPVGWTAALFAIGLSPLTSWIDPAYALYRQAWLIQPVSIFATSGANLLIFLTNFALAAVILVGPRRRRAITAGGVVVLMTSWTLLSVALLGVGNAGQSVRVAAVQPGAIPRVDEIPAARRASANDQILEQLEAATRTAAVDGAQLVVWPEKALQYFDPAVDDIADLRNLVAQTKAVLVIGYSPDPGRFNQATLLEPDGRFLGVYDKQHPVLFAGDHSIGGPVKVMTTSLGRIAPIICYDLDYEGTTRAAARQGANLLAVPSEDWPGIARQHYTHLVFRAVENRLSAVKADTAWGSAIIDPQGRILARHVTTDSTRALLVADLPLGTGTSVFVSIGNWTGWICVVLSALWLAIVDRARRRSRSTRTPDMGSVRS